MKKNCSEREYVDLWIDDVIMFEKFRPDLQNIDLEVTKKIVEDRLKLSNGVTMPLFVELNKIISADKEARTYFATEEAIHHIKAAAFLVHNPIAILLANCS